MPSKTDPVRIDTSCTAFRHPQTRKPTNRGLDAQTASLVSEQETAVAVVLEGGRGSWFLTGVHPMNALPPPVLLLQIQAKMAKGRKRPASAIEEDGNGSAPLANGMASTTTAAAGELVHPASVSSCYPSMQKRVCSRTHTNSCCRTASTQAQCCSTVPGALNRHPSPIPAASRGCPLGTGAGAGLPARM